MADLHDLMTRNDIKGGKKMKKFWICHVEYTNGGRHFQHWTLLSAQVEAERLARLPHILGREVFIFECIGMCKVERAPIKWEMAK